VDIAAWVSTGSLQGKAPAPPEAHGRAPPPPAGVRTGRQRSEVDLKVEKLRGRIQGMALAYAMSDTETSFAKSMMVRR
jgi:hypothetical protein